MSKHVISQSAITRSDRIRERELFRYYQPSDKLDICQETNEDSKNVEVKKASSPDVTLTALAQLVAIRLNVKTVLINVITKDTQWTISEGTKTLNLADTTKAAEEGDHLWIGCGSLAKEESLCENTVNLPAVLGGTSPFFTVPDLSEDKRFNHLFYVTETPFWRFYAGCPIRTVRGVNIGALCILDDKPRSGLNDEEQAFCDSIAQTVMHQLEMKREGEERKKAARMSKGLNAFVEGKSHIEEKTDDNRLSPDSRLVETSSPRTLNLQGSSSDDATGIIPRVLTSIERHPQSRPMQTDNQSPTDPRGGPPLRDAEAGKRRTLDRAANLLRHSLDLEGHGGVVFLDTTVGFSNPDDDPNSSSGDEDNNTSRPPSMLYHSNVGNIFGSISEEHRKMADILAQATPEHTGEQGTIFSSLDEHFLQLILKRHPRGKLWSFDEEGGFSSSEEERRFSRSSRSTDEHSQSRAHRRYAEARHLQRCFPDVRQLLFVPVWEASSSRIYSACFAWTSSAHQLFSSENQLNFLTAFGNSISAEISRLEMMAADQQKGDFIGSISHELRSPLHGVLASAEFLAETECDSFQSGLVSTIESCGRTLLDTINHVLDFSKINSFERNFRKTKKKISDGRASSQETLARTPNVQGLLNIFATTDVAAVCEEVVEGVYMGQVYQDISSMDISDITAGNRGRTSQKGLAGSDRALLGGSAGKASGKILEVILDITEGDYTFTTQPGALRRVIMNLFSNSLKYTEKGTITVKLELRELPNNTNAVEDKPNGKLLFLTVTDTGKGIGSHYLKTRLYTPFAQENNLAPGTGLGLSIVRSITNMLGGSIDIHSELGRGTEVKVVIPMMKQSDSETPISTPSTMSSADRSHDNSVSILKARASGLTVALFGFEPRSFTTTSIPPVLRHYVTSWFGLQIVDHEESTADIIIVDEEDALQLLSGTLPHGSSVIVLCGSTSRRAHTTIPKDGLHAIEYVSKPFGPYKLAKALQLCLKDAENLREQLRSLPGLSNSMVRNDIPTMDFRAMSLGNIDFDTHSSAADSSTTVIANDSTNAQMALTTPRADGLSPEDGVRPPDFPFPDQSKPGGTSESTLDSESPWQESKRPSLVERKTDPTLTKTAWTESEPETAATVSQQGISPTQPLPSPESAAPRILVVDDNKINLRLLRTFMIKRKYQDVDAAEDGKLAVQAFQQREEGYNIIFMDLSMPIMTGFEATRAIRAIEEIRRTTARTGEFKPALIIALTGLASGRDQSDAFTSGVDLFMTKPVSFKEVGKLLDNWELNHGTAPLTTISDF